MMHDATSNDLTPSVTPSADRSSSVAFCDEFTYPNPTMDHNTFTAQSGHGLRVAIVRARFNDDITSGLLAGAKKVLNEAGVTDERLAIVEVPGSFEIIHAANMLADTERYHAIICLGAIIKGATKHDEYLANAVYDGMKDITLRHRVPVVAGVLTVNEKSQALERSGEGPMNRGAEAAHVALEMANLSL